MVIPKPDTENGFEGVKIIFINERPGRVGPAKSGRISFENEDPTARWFRELFALTGIDRKDIFITNACLYYPADVNYKDRSPGTRELKCCAPILKDQVERIKPQHRAARQHCPEGPSLRVPGIATARALQVEAQHPLADYRHHTARLSRLSHVGSRPRNQKQERSGGRLAENPAVLEFSQIAARTRDPKTYN